jgi:flagellar M-ring protein FliF
MALSITKDTFNAEQAGKALGKLQGCRSGGSSAPAADRRRGRRRPDGVLLVAKAGLHALHRAGPEATSEATDLLRAAGIPFAIDPATGWHHRAGKTSTTRA